jgi:hypothetical protein
MESMEVSGEMAAYERALERGRELLGPSYDEQKFGSVMASFIGDPSGLNTALEELESRLTYAKDEKAKQLMRSAWLQKEDLATQVSEVLESQEEGAV